MKGNRRVGKGGYKAPHPHIPGNRKRRKKVKMAERLALKLFCNNKPWHYMMASGSSVATFREAMRLYYGDGNEQEEKEKRHRGR